MPMFLCLLFDCTELLSATCFKGNTSLVSLYGWDIPKIANSPFWDLCKWFQRHPKEQILAPSWLHFYNSSTDSLETQKTRLQSAYFISQAGIACIVRAEDALSFVHYVLTSNTRQDVMTFPIVVSEFLILQIPRCHSAHRHYLTVPHNHTLHLIFPQNIWSITTTILPRDSK